MCYNIYFQRIRIERPIDEQSAWHFIGTLLSLNKLTKILPENILERMNDFSAIQAIKTNKIAKLIQP